MVKNRYLKSVGWGAVFLGSLSSIPELLQAQTVSQNQQSERIPTVPQQLQVPAPLLPRKEPLLNLPSLQERIPTFSYPNQYAIKAKITKFIFKGNTVFSDQQLEAVVAPYIGREITFAELLEARAAITKYYNDRGYITSGALVPLTENQSIRTVNGGVEFTIQIVEGKLEEINVTGSDRLRQYVRSRLKATTAPALNYARLIEALRLLQTDPLIETISAQLNPGGRIGESLLDVQVKERQPFRVETILDNERSPAVGSFQRQVRLTHANLLGLGDELSLGYRNTNGSNAFATSYSVPINSQNGTLQFAYTTVSSDIIERPFSQLDIISDARAYELTVRQPLLRRATDKSITQLALGLSASRQESETFLLDTPFPLSAGADEQGRTRISAVRFFQEWNRRSGREILLARSHFSLGVSAFDATINDSAPDSRFFVWRGQAAWLRRIGDTSLLLRADMQLADRPVVPLEQFSLGGATTVRGYRQDALLNDNGFFASAELRIPTLKGSAGELQIIPFVDVGTAWNNDSADNELVALETGTLASVGLGLQYQIGDYFSARLDWGIPLLPIDTNSDSNSWQDKGLHFSIRYQPF